MVASKPPGAYIKSGGEFDQCDRAPLVPNLDALRALDDFKKLLAELAKPAEPKK